MASTTVPLEEEMTSAVVQQPSSQLKVVAFINNSSGSGKGGELEKMLSVELGPENVFIFGRDKPGDVIQRLANEYAQHNIRVIVGGGDGSVNWVLSIIHQLGLSERVAVGIIPNGTGNDTSRYLGWGQCQFGDKYTLANVKLMKDPQCPVVDFDRWQLFFSLKKETMIQRTAELRKSGEVPESHTHIVKEPKTHLTAKSPTTTKPSPDTPESPLVDLDVTSSASNSTGRTSVSIQMPTARTTDIFLPKFYRSMLRLTELQYTERYKYLHSQHWPENFNPAVSAQVERMMKALNSNDDESTPAQPSDSNSTLNVNPRIVELRKQYSDLLEKQSKWMRFSWSFNNYFSFGIDAQAMNYFGIHRDNNPCCYQCRLCTLSWIGICSTTTCIRCQKKPLRYRVDILYKDSDLVPVGADASRNIIPKPTDDAALAEKLVGDVDVPTEIVVEAIGGLDGVTPAQFAQDAAELEFFNDAGYLANGYKWLNATFSPLDFEALVLLNIPSYAGGRNIWGTKEQKKDWLIPQNQQAQKTDDGSLETVSFTGFKQMQFTILTNSSTYRLGQIQGLRIYMENDGFVQLDGEAWIQPRGVMEIYRSSPGKMLKNENPDYPCC